MSEALNLSLHPADTALVVIDLQHGIVSNPWAPHSGADVVARCQRLAAQFRAAQAPVVQVRVGWSADLADLPPQAVDQPMGLRPGALPANWSEFVPGQLQPGDICVTKRQWGAFHGTELDLQLRRRGVRRMVLVGIATNFGVESTARQAWELGYELVVVEDACTTVSAEMHALTMEKVLPRIARVRTLDQLSLRQP